MKKKSIEVIQSIKNGDNDKALQYLYKDPLRKIRTYILQNSGSIEDADDVFQDAIVVLFHYVKSGKYKEEYDLDGFLYKVSKNAWIDLERKKKRMIKEELIGFDLADDKDLLLEMIRDEKHVVFHKLFDKLGENCKKLLSYVIFDKKSMKEITQLIGYKDEKVAVNQHYRCKKYFANLIMENQEALKVLKY